MSDKPENPMRKISVEKLTLNIGAGEAGDKLDKGKKLLEMLSNKKVVVTRTHKRSTFGAAKGRPIGAKINIRNKDAMELLEKLLISIEKKIKLSSFDNQGNFSFGIKEYINIPGVRYDPDIGILGMDVCVTLKRPGFRIKNRRIKNKIGEKHKIAKKDSINFAKNVLGINVLEGEK